MRFAAKSLGVVCALLAVTACLAPAARAGTPIGPSELGYFPTSAPVVDVEIVGTTAYLAAGAEGLLIVDVSDPTLLGDTVNPPLLGSLDFSGDVVDVAISGTLLFLAVSEDGMVVVDVNDPSDPSLRGSFVLPGSVNAVAADGSSIYAFEARMEGEPPVTVHRLHSLFITDPDSVFSQGSLTIDFAVDAARIEVFGNTLYLAAGDLHRIDVGVFPPTSLEVYDSDDSSTLAVGYPTAFLADTSALEVVTVGPNAPMPQCDLSPLGVGDPKDLAMAGALAYVAGSNGGMAIVDTQGCSGSEMADEVGSLPARALDTHSESIAVAAEWVFIGQGADTCTEFIPDPDDPGGPEIEVPNDLCGLRVADGGLGVVLVELDVAQTPGADNCAGAFRAIDVQGSRAYAACDEGPGASTLQVWDVGDPSSPSFLGEESCTAPCDLRDVVVQDALVFSVTGSTAGANREMLVWDVSDATAPTLDAQRSRDIPNSPVALDASLEVNDRYVYVAGDDGLLTVFDALRTDTTLRLSSLPRMLDGRGVAYTRGENEWLASSRDADLVLIDVDSKEGPVLPTLAMPLAGVGGEIATRGTRAYTSDPFTIVDLIAPISPGQISSLPLIAGDELAVEGNRAYLVNTLTGSAEIVGIKLDDESAPELITPPFDANPYGDVDLRGPFVYAAVPAPAASATLALALTTLVALRRLRRPGN